MELKYKCKICDKQFDTRKQLCCHLQWHHKITSKNYYDTYLSKNNIHKCEVCGNIVDKFLNIDEGYKKTCSIKCADKINNRYEKIRKTFIEKGYINKFVEPFEVNKTDDLSKYDHRQKFYYKCEDCGKLFLVNYNFNKNLKNRDSFICNKCRNYHRQIEKYNKIPLTNERIFIDKNTDLTRYFCKQNVVFSCEDCGKIQTATIGYMRQTKRQKTKFKCQDCSSVYTVRKIYGVDRIFQLHTNQKYISKSATKFFNELVKLLNRKDHLHYNENEWYIKDKNGVFYKYDFTDNISKIIIEYNGDYWHPKCLNDPDWNNNRLDCNETWLYNENKKLCAEEHGYKIYYIWEHDVNECLSECLAYCKSLLED